MPHESTPTRSHYSTKARPYARPLLPSRAITGATTEEQRQCFLRDGFFVKRGLLTDGDCDAMFRRAQLITSHSEGGKDLGRALVTPSVDRRHVQGLESWQRASKIFRIHGPEDGGTSSASETVFERYSWDPRVLGVLVDLFGEDELTCFLSQFIFKDGCRGDLPGSLGQPWHQDSYYFGATGRHRQVGVWIAVTDVHEKNGPLSVVPGSHTEHIHIVGEDQREHAQLGYVEIFDFFEGPDGAANRAAAQEVLMRRGDVLFFDANLVHGSSDNTSTDHRATMLYHYTLSSTEWKFVAPNMEIYELTDARRAKL